MAGDVVGQGFEDEVHDGRDSPEKCNVVGLVPVSHPRKRQSYEHVDAKTQIFVSCQTEQIKPGGLNLHGVETHPDGNDFQDLSDEAFGRNIGQNFWIELAGGTVAEGTKEDVRNKGHEGNVQVIGVVVLDRSGVRYRR